jgi:hypothetical protein
MFGFGLLLVSICMYVGTSKVRTDYRMGSIGVCAQV